MSQFVFDATKVSPQSDRSAVPPDTYDVILTGSDIKPGKTPTDRQMSLNMRIISGPLNGGSIFQTLNIIHSNPTAQQIAQSEFSALCHAIGILNISDTTQLHGRPFKVKTSIRNGTDKLGQPDGKTYTEVDAYLRADGSPISGGAGAPGAVGQAPPAWANPGAQAAPPPTAMPMPPGVAPLPPQQFQQPPPMAPQPPQQPAPPVMQQPVAERMFYVAKGGQMLTQQPLPQSQVMQHFGSDLASIQILENGSQTWVPGATLAQAAPVQAIPPPAAGVPPWLQQPPV